MATIAEGSGQDLGGTIYDIFEGGLVKATSNAVNRLTGAGAAPAASSSASAAGGGGVPAWVMVGGSVLFAVGAALLIKKFRRG